MNRIHQNIGLVFCLLFCTTKVYAGFLPRVGDEAQYEVSVPTSTGLVKKSILSYLPGEDKFTISIEQDNGNGRIQKRIVETPRMQVEAEYIDDLDAFCQLKGGVKQNLDVQGQTLQTCLTTKDDKVFKQRNWWAANLPFGLVLSIKDSPLHPKASTTTRLMSSQRGSQQ